MAESIYNGEAVAGNAERVLELSIGPIRAYCTMLRDAGRDDEAAVLAVLVAGAENILWPWMESRQDKTG